MARMPGSVLNVEWGIGAKHVLYRQTGDFYMPAALVCRLPNVGGADFKLRHYQGWRHWSAPRLGFRRKLGYRWDSGDRDE